MKKINDRGSTIVTGIIIVMIVFIILGTALGIATSYQKRAINEHARKQAYLNAIGICDAIAGELNGSNSADFLPPSNGTAKVIENVNLPAQMVDTQHGDKEVTSSTGIITGEIIYDKISNGTVDETAIFIKITSKYSNQTQFVQLKLRKYGGHWKKVYYSDDNGNEVDVNAST